MNVDLSTYSTLVFDCDGVVLDSNRIKTEAFRTAAMPWGEAATNALVDHHVSNGGISRYNKFAHFLDNIIPQHALNTLVGERESIIEKLLSTYAAEVRAGLMNCIVADGLQELRTATREATWLIVSGGDQAELREVFALRGLDHLFDGGIFGSPEDKDTILASRIASGGISPRALFIGDSLYDYEAATRAGLDFIFAYGWTEVSSWEEFANQNGIRTIESISKLIHE